MNLKFSALLVRERKSGETMPLVLDSSAGRLVAFAAGLVDIDSASVSKAHEKLRDGGEEGRALRQKYSHALFIVENTVRASYEFPDESALALDADRQKLIDARRVLDMTESEIAGALAAVQSAEAAFARRVSASRTVAELERKLGTGSPTPPVPSDTGDNGGQSLASTLSPGTPSTLASVPPVQPAAPATVELAPHSEPQPNGFVPTPETGANGVGNAMPVQTAVPVESDGKTPAPFPGDGKTTSTDSSAPGTTIERGELVEQPRLEGKTTASGTPSVPPAPSKVETTDKPGEPDPKAPGGTDSAASAATPEAGATPGQTGEIVAPDGVTPARDAVAPDPGSVIKNRSRR